MHACLDEESWTRKKSAEIDINGSHSYLIRRPLVVLEVHGRIHSNHGRTQRHHLINLIEWRWLHRKTSHGNQSITLDQQEEQKVSFVVWLVSSQPNKSRRASNMDGLSRSAAPFAIHTCIQPWTRHLDKYSHTTILWLMALHSASARARSNREVSSGSGHPASHRAKAASVEVAKRIHFFLGLDLPSALALLDTGTPTQSLRNTCEDLVSQEQNFN